MTETGLQSYGLESFSAGTDLFVCSHRHVICDSTCFSKTARCAGEQTTKQMSASFTFVTAQTCFVQSQSLTEEKLRECKQRRKGVAGGHRGDIGVKGGPKSEATHVFRTNFDLLIFTIYLPKLVYWVGFGAAMTLKPICEMSISSFA